MSWTEDRVETLKKLWTKGYSATQIAKELGGVTRNAVIGKVHRLKLPKRGLGSPSQLLKSKKTREKSPKPKQLGTSNALMLIASSSQCKWPIGDPLDRDFSFCSRKCGEKDPYCESHTKAALKKYEQAEGVMVAIAA